MPKAQPPEKAARKGAMLAGIVVMILMVGFAFRQPGNDGPNAPLLLIAGMIGIALFLLLGGKGSGR